MKVPLLWILALPALMAVVIVPSAVTRACPLGCCRFQFQITLANQLPGSNVILLAERVSGDEQAEQTSFVVRHLEGDEAGEWNFGDSISIPYFSKDDPPGLQLLLGSKNPAGRLEWQRVAAATEGRLKYILEAPSPDVASQRLPYFLQYLESTDALVAADAFLELELADLAIADLTRWEDWSVQDRLMSLYGQGEYNLPPIKRAIGRYLLAAEKITAPFSDNSTQLHAEVPKSERLPHVLQARAYLERLCQQDLKTVQQAERFLLLK